MTGRNSITIESVLNALELLGVKFTWVGKRREVGKVCSLLAKEPGGLYYFSGTNAADLSGLVESVVICRPGLVLDQTAELSFIEVIEDPQLVFYRLCAHMLGSRPLPGIHPTAIIHVEAKLGEGVHVGPYAVIGSSVIGNDTVIHAHVVVMDDCVIGDRVVIEPNCCIGGNGVAWIWDTDGKRVILPQVGGVVIEDDVFLGTDVTIVRGMLNEATTIGARTLIAHGSKIGHSSRLGKDCHLANNVSIAGSVAIGDRCFRIGLFCSTPCKTATGYYCWGRGGSCE
ncbi:MAG: hypothetical protein IPH21_15910 [Flavobacteriales bacterium]|nr:hypothetical protein [Flavobacteriales bacterium]